MHPAEQLDGHLRRHGIGSCAGGRLEFDWPALLERRLHLIPGYEVNSPAIYAAVIERELPALFYSGSGSGLPIPDPADQDFFIEVESAVAALADERGSFIYVNFFTEDAYLAITSEQASRVFGAAPGEMLGQSLLSSVGQDILQMRRHRHGIRLFQEAARHHFALQLELNLPYPNFPPWR